MFFNKNSYKALIFLFLNFSTFHSHPFSLIDDETISFIKGILRNPKTVGAFGPCSKHVAKEISRHIADSKGFVKVLEVGAGTGQLTNTVVSILESNNNKNLIEGYKFDVVEIDPEYCNFLNKKFKNTSNVKVHCMDASVGTPEKDYDFIISTLPFGNFSSELVDKVLNNFKNILKPNGIISYVEYMIFPRLNKLYLTGKKKEEFVKKRCLIKEFQESGSTEVNKVWKNLFPINVIHVQFDQQS